VKLAELVKTGEKQKESTKRVSVTLRGKYLDAFNHLKRKFPNVSKDATIVEACILASAIDEGFEVK